MSIERHRLQREKNAGAYMEPAPDGNWVTFADHAAELARVEKLLDAARDAARVAIDQMDVWQRACAAASVMHTKTLADNALLRAECEAWRKAAGSMPKPRSAADHDHELEGKWDWTGEPCVECALWITADNARAATDAAGALKGVER